MLYAVNMKHTSAIERDRLMVDDQIFAVAPLSEEQIGSKALYDEQQSGRLS